MNSGHFSRGSLAPVLSALALVIGLAPYPVAAQVHQPTGELVPTEPGCNGGRPTGLLSVLACACDRPGVCNIGSVCPSETSCDDGRNAVCESRMWHVFNDNTCIPSMHDGLDPRTDARTTPETFAPVCGLTFKIESRGTARFHDAFGWYNANGTSPSPDDLHVMLGPTTAPGTSAVLDVRSDPAYRGGEVGFFLLTPEAHGASGTCAGGDCDASVERLRRGEGYAYFSEAALNPDHRGADSFVHLLVLDSVVVDRKFYFAWEDTFDSANDDFTDLVTSVEGVECAGGGAPCETGRPGACAHGVTRCDAGVLTCQATFDGEPERCDGLDNDCDGQIDDSATCDDPTQVCHVGACVPRCQIGQEFTCPFAHDLCDEATGLCVEPACIGVTCGAGTVCRGGTCQRECEGVTCPHGLVCLLDACLDPCDGVTCAVGESCRTGVCVPGCNQCNGLTCASGESCDDATGQCRDTSCAAGCGSGTFCDHGSCRDACDGAVCPRGAACRDGRCVPPSSTTDGGVRVNADAAWPTLPDHGAQDPGCACVVGGRTHAPASSTVLFGAAFALLLAARRRRAVARRSR